MKEAIDKYYYLSPDSCNHPHPHHRRRQQRPRHRPAHVPMAGQFDDSKEGGKADGGTEPQGADGCGSEDGEGQHAQLHHQLGRHAQQQHGGQQCDGKGDQRAHDNAPSMDEAGNARAGANVRGAKGSPPEGFVCCSCCAVLPSRRVPDLIFVMGRPWCGFSATALTSPACRSRSPARPGSGTPPCAGEVTENGKIGRAHV